MKKKINERIYFYLTCLLAFLLPVLPAVLPAVIVLLGINWIAGGSYINLFKKNHERIYFFVFIALYILYLTGMLWSENSKYGWKDLETKLSLLIFPLIYFSSEKLNRQKVSVVLTSLTWGCLAASAICFANAVYQYFHVKYLLANNIWAWNYGINFFLKDRLSFLIHPSYTSMYFMLALAGIYFLKRDRTDSPLWWKYLIPFILSVFILLFSSKAGILSLFLLGVYVGLNLIFKERKFKPVLIGAVLAACVFLSLYFFAHQFALRINSVFTAFSENVDVRKSEESTASRIAIWDAAKEVIGKYPLAGTGTGDAKDELMKEYQKQGMAFALNENLNAHSQFLQTFVALGIPGFLLLCACLLIPLFLEWSKKNYLYITFILLILLNLAAESMFETQAGVVFYAFFNSLLVFSKNDA